MINSEKIEDLKKIIKRPVYIWQEEENKIKEYKKKYEKILKIYPDGVDFWKKTNTGFSYKKVIDDEALIKKYDEDIKRKIEDEKSDNRRVAGKGKDNRKIFRQRL